MAAVGNLFIRMGLKANEFYSGMNKISKSVLTQERQLLNLRRVAVAAFTGWGIKRLGESFLDAASTMEGYEVRLKAIMGSTEEGNKVFKEMADYAASVPFSFDKVMESATALAGVVRGGSDEVARIMPMIGDLAATYGLTLEQTTQQVVRMFSAGAGAADLFRERGVLAMMGFEAGVSYTAAETMKKMIDSWNAADSRFKGMTDKLKTTWAGTMTMFSDHWLQFRDAVMKSGPFQAMKHHAQLLLKEINRLKAEGKLDEWAKSTASIIVTSFGYATYAVQTFWNAFRWGEFVIAIMTKTFADFFLNILGPFAFLGETVKGWVAELEHASNAADMWAQDTSVKISETREFFEGLRQKLIEIKEAHTVLKDTIIENHNAMNEAATIAYDEDFSMLGERATWWEADSRARVMAEQKALMDIQAANRQHQAITMKQSHQVAQFQIQTAQLAAQTILAISNEQSGALFYLARSVAVVTAIINAWLAYTQALASPPGPPWTIPIAKWALASGLAAAALIGAQTFMGHAEGGWITQGSGNRDDVFLGMTGKTAHMGMGGEFVVNKNAAAENAALLEAINRGETIGGITIPITLELDGEILWRRTYRATRDGNLQIHEGALVSR